ncbi:histidine-phosphotransfer domain, HPT domain-containing protein [Schizophyllum commune H4-8]|nr:histidine-phosphotransfer domain, HPT domain-containing protein [Schizophyllum commune H4-8]KAI5897887.1 histidine-phosphotransfer domain, HPT domain-containing protein [Schizophyllum commune H4-8]
MATKPAPAKAASPATPDKKPAPAAATPPPTKAAAEPEAPTALASDDEDDDEKEDEEKGPPVKMEIFRQILELDDEDSHDFSREMVSDFFSQARDTLKTLDGAFTSSNLTTLADRGHFLKSSSASLGIYKVQEACGKIEQYGKKVADDGSSLEKDDALKLIDALLKKVKVDIDAAETWLDEWYERDGNAT